MRLDYKDYQTLLFALCRQMRKDPASSSLLINATPANLRDKCISVYSGRGLAREKGDEKILTDFFGAATGRQTFDTLIANCPPERFKALQNLVNGKTKAPDVVIVELLAWLLDFRHRPFRHGMDVDLSDEERVTLRGAESRTREDSGDNAGQNRRGLEVESEKSAEEKEPLAIPFPFVSPTKKPKKKWVMIPAVFLPVAGLVAGFLMRGEQQGTKMAFMKGNNGCMYWAGDHYEEVPCEEDGKDRFKFPLDVQKMNHFKRITRTDTISEKSIGKIYYLRINGGIEYYTGGGNHPVEITRKLQPLSAYMFEKHLAKEDTLNNLP